jgi:dTMP kinase
MFSPLRADHGLLVAFEGLDQSGKQTQAELLRDRLASNGRAVRLLSFPDYQTVIGAEIGRALRGEREYTADVMQLLYVANRYEWKGEITRAKAAGTIVVCDRYLASSIAYGEAQGLDAAWLADIQKYLPQPDITFLLDIAPDASARRKTTDRDKYERDLSLLSRVRSSYLHQSDAAGWVRLDAARPADVIAGDVYKAVGEQLRERDR